MHDSQACHSQRAIGATRTHDVRTIPQSLRNQPPKSLRSQKKLKDGLAEKSGPTNPHSAHLGLEIDRRHARPRKEPRRPHALEIGIIILEYMFNHNISYVLYYPTSLNL